MTDKRNMLQDFSTISGSLSTDAHNLTRKARELFDELDGLATEISEHEEDIDGHLEALDDEEEEEGNELDDHDLWAFYRAALNVKEVWDDEFGEDVPTLVIHDHQYVPRKLHHHQHELVNLERIALNLWLHNEDMVECSSGLSMQAMQEVIRDYETSDDDDSINLGATPPSSWEGRTAPGEHFMRDEDAA
jgi:hypothetical protein